MAKKLNDSRLTLEDMKAMREDLAKDFGVELLFGDDEKFKLRKLPLGISTLDNALGGGFAFDRVTLLVGEFSAGKTVLAMLAIKAAQAEGMTTAFIDVEKTWTPEWAAQLGINPSDVLVVRPRTGEQAFGSAVGLVKRGIDLLVIDSLAAMRSTSELDADEDTMFEKDRVGGNAKLIGKGLTAIEAENKGTLVICINQLRDKPGIVYGSPEVLPGGKAQSYVAWQLVRVRRGAWIEEGEKRVGYRLKISLQKNKQGSPFSEAEVPFYFTGEIDEIAGLVELGIELGAIEQKGAKYFMDTVDPDTGEVSELMIYGRKKLIDTFRERTDLQDLIRKKASNIEEIDI